MRKSLIMGSKEDVQKMKAKREATKQVVTEPVRRIVTFNHPDAFK